MRIARDLSIYNEATGFSVHARGLGGLDRSAIDDDMERCVRDGLVVPVELVQDDSLQVRVVVGDLTPAEAEEWVGRVVAWLRVPDGSLAVEGGFDPDTEDDGEFVKYVDVPPGDYRVEVLTYLHGINGDYCLGELEGEHDSLGAWFRRTRPDTPMPAWAKAMFADEPSLDPGHEDEWDAYAEEIEALSDDEERELYGEGLIDFLVHLTPLGEGGVADASPLGEDGWFAIDTGARRPERFPLGIPFEPDPSEDEDDEED